MKIILKIAQYQNKIFNQEMSVQGFKHLQIKQEIQIFQFHNETYPIFM